MLDIHRLKIFAKVAEYKSFSLAAHACLLTQPTVSQHIASLEEYLQLPLFDRLGKEVCLTKAGELLYRYAKQIDSLSEEALQSLELLRGKKGGQLEIGASTIPGEYILPQLLGRFKQEYPGLRSSVHIADTHEAISQLEHRRVDIAIVGAKVKSEGLTFTRCIDDELVLIVPRGHPWWNRKTVQLDELMSEPFVMREIGSGTRMALGKQLLNMKSNPAGLNIAMVAGSTTAVKESVRAGLGVSVLSRRAVSEEIKMGLFWSPVISDVTFKRHFYIVRDRRSPSPICKAFVQFLIMYGRDSRQQ